MIDCGCCLIMWLLVVGDSLLLLVVGCWLATKRHATGCWLLVAGDWLMLSVWLLLLLLVLIAFDD